MSMSIAVKLRQGRGPMWSSLKQAARAVLRFHIPVGPATRPLFRGLYGLHDCAREGLAWMLRFFWYEPLFRSQCAAVGPAFEMEQLPYMCGQGRITIGAGVRLSGKPSMGFSNQLYPEPELRIGDDTFIGHDCSFHVARAVTLGRHCLLATGVRIYDFDGHPVDAERRRAKDPTPPQGIAPVVIGDDVWIGNNAIILKGVTIGARAIVGAGAVVTKDVPPDTVAAGSPARVVRLLAT
jgi:acetyltransferase-like isoleucine patch superfamily enzyme